MFYLMRTGKNPSVRLRFLGQIRNRPLYLGVLYSQSRLCDNTLEGICLEFGLKGVPNLVLDSCKETQSPYLD